MPCCCMNDFASLSADFTTPHFSADLPYIVLHSNNDFLKTAQNNGIGSSLDDIKEEFGNLYTERARTDGLGVQHVYSLKGIAFFYNTDFVVDQIFVFNEGAYE